MNKFILVIILSIFLKADNLESILSIKNNEYSLFDKDNILFIDNKYEINTFKIEIQELELNKDIKNSIILGKLLFLGASFYLENYLDPENKDLLLKTRDYINLNYDWKF